MKNYRVADKSIFTYGKSTSERFREKIHFYSEFFMRTILIQCGFCQFLIQLHFRKRLNCLHFYSSFSRSRCKRSFFTIEFRIPFPRSVLLVCVFFSNRQPRCCSVKYRKIFIGKLYFGLPKGEGRFYPINKNFCNIYVDGIKRRMKQQYQLESRR